MTADHGKQPDWVLLARQDRLDQAEDLLDRLVLLGRLVRVSMALQDQLALLALLALELLELLVLTLQLPDLLALLDRQGLV